MFGQNGRPAKHTNIHIYYMAKNQSQAAANVAAPVQTEKLIDGDGAKNLATAVNKPAEPTSPILDELREKRLGFKKLARTFEPDSDDENNALMEAYKIDQLIKAEIANIKTAEAQMELQTKRNARVQLFDDAIQAYNDAQSHPEDATIKAAYDAAREVVVNILIGSLAAKVAPVKVAGDKTAAPAGSDILTLHLANLAVGMDDSASRKALEAAGHKRSTVWHTVNNYNKAK